MGLRTLTSENMKLVSTIENIETITVVFTSVVSSNIGGYLKQIVDPRIVIYYHPPMKLREGNVFTGVCLFMKRG